MKQFILKWLKQYRTKLMKKISETTFNHESLFDKFVSLIVSSVLYAWYCAIDSIVIRLESVLVCSLFGEDFYDDSPNAAFMRILMDNKEKVEPVICNEGEGTTLLVFYSHKLKNVSELFKDNPEVYKLYIEAVNGKMHTCTTCGCRILGPFPYTYRNNCGCVGRSYECYICRQYTNKGTYYIRKYRKKHGSKKTVIKATIDGFSQEGDESL